MIKVYSGKPYVATDYTALSKKLERRDVYI